MKTTSISRAWGAGIVIAIVTVLMFPCASSHVWADEPATDVEGKQLTSETLGEMLVNMGFEPKPVRLSSGQLIQTVSMSRDNWNFYFELSIGFDGSLVWFIAPLGTVESAEQFPQAVAMKLLEENFNSQPMAFTYHPPAKKIDLIGTLPNSDVTAAQVRSSLERMMEIIKRTQPLWNPAKWETAPAVSSN